MDDLNEPEGVSFDTLIRSDEVSAAAAFRAHARALASRLSAEEDELAKSAEPMTPAILHARASWFYALAARVGLPLDAETSASVRALARALAMRRSKVTSSRDPVPAAHPGLPRCRGQVLWAVQRGVTASTTTST